MKVPVPFFLALLLTQVCLAEVPLTALPESPAEGERVLRFASDDLAAFSRTMSASRSAAPSAGRRVAQAALLAFDSPDIAAALEQVGDAAANEDAVTELVQAQNRLNESLHPLGMHVVIDDQGLAMGRVELRAYVVLARHPFTVLGKPFIVYETRPVTAGRDVAAYGHADRVPGYLFVFSDRTEDAAKAHFIDSIGLHEGFHLYAEPMLASGLRRGTVAPDVSGAWHEKGAYLYQLEASDPQFVQIDLSKIFLLALGGDAGRFPENVTGARGALAALQSNIHEVQFWDAAENRPLPAALPDLLRLPPALLRRAAAQARSSFELQVRN